MIRKVLAGAVVAGLSLGLVATPASAATATSGPLTISVADTTVYKTASCAYYPYTVKLNTDSPYTMYDVEVTASSPTAYGGSDYMYGETDANGDAVQAGSVYMCPTLDGTGKFTYTATAELYDENYYQTATETASTTSTYKTPAAVTAKASTTKPKKGKTVKVSGKVTYKNPDTWKSHPAKKQTVTLQYKPAGSSTWTNVSTAKTTKSGKYTLKTKAQKDGHYRVSYSNGTSTGTSQAIYVDVK